MIRVSKKQRGNNRTGDPWELVTGVTSPRVRVPGSKKGELMNKLRMFLITTALMAGSSALAAAQQPQAYQGWGYQDRDRDWDRDHDRDRDRHRDWDDDDDDDRGRYRRD